MAGVNKVIIVGNLGKDPEVRTFNNGGKVVNLSVATSETWKDKQTGERKERVEWHRVVIQNEGAAKFAEQYLRKGSTVYLEGQLETRKWTDQGGAEKFTTEIVLRPFNSVLQAVGKREDSGAGGGGQRNDDDRGYQRPEGGAATGNQRSAGYGGGARSDLDDEIPF